MVYLRGTANQLQAARKRQRAGPPTLANKVAKLQRQVAHNTPGLNYFLRTESPNSDVSTGFDYQVANVNPTSEYVGSTQYRTEITGDTFYNKRIKIVYTADTDKISAMRLVVYSPKLADTIFKPQNTPQGFCTVADPAAFNVYFDEVIEMKESLDPLSFSRVIQLYNKMTEYNGGTATLERGPIRITLLYKNTIDANAGVIGYQLTTQDK